MRWLLICLLFLSFQLKAEKDSTKSISFGVNYLGGKVIVHTPKIHIDPPPYSQAILFSYCKQHTGTKDWQQRFGFPESALNLSFTHYGKKELGNAIGIYPSIQFRLISQKNAYWYFKVGGGIGIVSKSWKRIPTEDSTNNILGSTLNNFTMIQSGVRFKVAKNWTFQSGIHFFHISNAASRQPNYGINTIGAFIGLNYHPLGVVMQFAKIELPKNKIPYNIGLKATLAFAEAKAVDGPLYPYYHISLFGSKMYRNKNRAMLGIDATYSAELYTAFKNNYKFIGTEKQHAIRYTVFGAHEFVFGKIGLPLQYGFYLNRPTGGRKTYQKLGINYHFYHNDNHIVKDIFLMTQLITELVNAQYAEIGFGVML